MKTLLCPTCSGNLKIEHYAVEVTGTKALIHTSRLLCTQCPYKKEPKQLRNPKIEAIIESIEKERREEMYEKARIDEQGHSLHNTKL